MLQGDITLHLRIDLSHSVIHMRLTSFQNIDHTINSTAWKEADIFVVEPGIGKEEFHLEHRHSLTSLLYAKG